MGYFFSFYPISMLMFNDELDYSNTNYINLLLICLYIYSMITLNTLFRQIADKIDLN